MDVPCHALRRARANRDRKLYPRCFSCLSMILLLSLIICEVKTTQNQYQSHDNIFRIQLWDSDALSRSSRLSDDKPLVTTENIIEISQVLDDGNSVKQVHVKVDDLMGDMFNTYYESHLNIRDVKARYRRHRKHNKNRRRKTRDNSDKTYDFKESRSNVAGLNSRFKERVQLIPHAFIFPNEKKALNVLAYENQRKDQILDGQSSASAIGESKQGSKENKTLQFASSNASGVSGVEGSPWGNSTPNKIDSTNNELDSEIGDSSIYKSVFDNKVFTRKVHRQIDNVEELDKTISTDTQDSQLSKQVAVVRKCCPSGQNITAYLINGTRGCAPTYLTFQPLFYEMYDSTHFTLYTSNLFETIVGNPCQNKRYRLEPERNDDDKFYLFTNGSIFAPFRTPQMLGPNDFCMDTFWNSTNPAGVTLPVVCFEEYTETAGSSASLVVYATGLLISVPFLVATTLSYLLTPELREAHGLALASHCGCLAVAFACLAATQLAGHAFPKHVCTGIAHVIQFSFIACFFWLNVMCYNTWTNVRHLSATTSRAHERRRFALYSVYAWLLPLALLLVSLVMDFSPAVPSTYVKPDFGVVGCWFKSDQGALPFFYAPIGCILLANVIIFVLTSRAFAKQLPRLERLSIAELTMAGSCDDSLRLSDPTSASDATSSPSDDSPVTNKLNNFKNRWKKYKKIYRMCCLLTILMGLSCVMEVVSRVAGEAGAWSVFDVLNALQGVVVFSMFVAMKPVRGIIWRRLKQTWSCLRHKRDALSETMSERTIIRSEHKRERVYV